MAGLRGDTIGRAYIKILADGSGLPKSIRDQMDETQPIAESAGRRNSQAYADAFHEEMKKTGDRKITKALNEGIGKSDAIEHYFNSDQWRKQLARLEREFGDVGVRIGHNIEEGVRSSGDLGGVEAKLHNIGAVITREQKIIKKANDDFERDFRRNLAQWDRDTANIFGNIAREAGNVGNAFARTQGVIRGLFTRMGKDWDAFGKTFERDGKRPANSITKFGDSIDRVGNKVGKAFGRGGRNDALNFFGAFAQAPVEIVGKFAQGIGKLIDVGKNMKVAYGGANGAFEGIMAAGKQLGPIMSNVYALGGAIGGLVLIGGPVAGFISSLAAAIVALGSAVAFALGAGLGVLAGLLLPVAAGLGTVGLAFIGMSDKTKKALKESLKPFTDQLKDLQAIARTGILKGLRDAGPDLGKGLKEVAPLIQATSDAIGDMIGRFAKGTASPGFKKFITTMSIFIPDAIRSIGDILSNVFSGLGGIFEGVIPITQDFLGWLTGITEEFANWGQTSGPEDVIGFMETAKGAAEDLWGLISSVGELLGRVLFNKDAAKGGGSIIDSMTEKVQGWIDTLKKDPDAFKNWIGDGVDSIKKIGKGLEDLADMFDKLDTPKNRKAATQVLGLIEGGLNAVSTTIGIVSGAWEGFMSLLEVVPQIGVIKQMKDIYDNAVKLKDQIAGIDWGGLWNKIPKPDFGKLFGKFHLKDVINPSGVLGAITGPFKGKSGNSLRSMGKFLLRNIINPGGVLGAILSPFRGKASNALKAMGKFLLKAVINPSGILSAVTSPFKGLNDDILKAIGKVALKLLVDAAGAAAAVIAPFKGLASSIVSAIGTIVPKVSLPKISLPHIPGTAVGGMFLGPQMRLIGEAGPEAVVPLARPLSQVDPAVRALSAFAQGKWGAETTNNNNQRSLNVGGLTIITPTKDPAAVARETVNRMVAASYM